MPPVKCYIVGLGGTLRPNSTTEMAMRHVLATAERAGARVRSLSGADLRLPLYQPDSKARDEVPRTLVAEFAAADGSVLASPGYHGTISVRRKNAQHYSQDRPMD